MRNLHTRSLPVLAGTLLLCLFNRQPAFARGSQVGHDDPWNSEHINRLPSEVRDAVIICAEICRAPVTISRPILIVHR
jgi:hypothetical protein